MQAIGAFEAKTHFSELLVKVSNGESIIITRHGEEVAMLVPIDASKARKTSVQASIDTIRSLRKGTKLGKNLSVKMLKEMGRK
jgi:prevent-host-death family protein